MEQQRGEYVKYSHAFLLKEFQCLQIRSEQLKKL